MGNGIITPNGATPLEEWQLRIASFGSPELSHALGKFLGGDKVQSKDGVLEISVYPTARHDAHKFTVLCPGAPFKAELVVRAVSLSKVGPKGDKRDAFPGPDAWQGDVKDLSSVWELFNCVVHTLISRDSA